MSANVKPLTHWAIYKGYKLRFRSRAPEHVTGVLTNAEGVEMAFDYLPAERLVQTAGRRGAHQRVRLGSRHAGIRQ